MIRKPFAYVVFAVLLLAAACGSDSAETSVDADTSDTSSADTEPATEPSNEEPTDEVTDLVTVVGLYFDDGSTVGVCEMLLESFPPQCGGLFTAIDNPNAVDVGEVLTEDGVTWSETESTFTGTMTGDTLVVASVNGG